MQIEVQSEREHCQHCCIWRSIKQTEEFNTRKSKKRPLFCCPFFFFCMCGSLREADDKSHSLCDTNCWICLVLEKTQGKKLMNCLYRRYSFRVVFLNDIYDSFIVISDNAEIVLSWYLDCMDLLQGAVTFLIFGLVWWVSALLASVLSMVMPKAGRHLYICVYLQRCRMCAW